MQHILQTFSELSQELVATEVPHTVVDVLEVVDIEEQGRKRVLMLLTTLDVLFEQADQMGTVRQVGQWIVKGHALQFFFMSFTYRDVLEHTDVVNQMVFIVHHRADGGELRVNAAIFFTVDEFAFPLPLTF